MSWYDNSSGRKAFWSRHLGAGVQCNLVLGRPLSSPWELKRRPKFYRQVSAGPSPLEWHWVPATNMVYIVGKLANLTMFWCLKWKALVGNSLHSGLRPTRGPWSSTLRTTSRMTLSATLTTISAMVPASALTSGMAPAMTSRAGLWYIPHSSAQPRNITSEHFSSFQHPLVNHLEGFLIWFSPTKSRQLFNFRPLVLSGCCRVSSLIQRACQGGEDIMDYSPSPLGPTRWETWETFSTNRYCGKCSRSSCQRFGIPLVPWWTGPPLGQVLMHYLSILSRWAILPLSALTQQCARTFMQDNRLARSSQLPPGVLIKEKFSIYPLLCFSHQESCFPGLFPGSLGFLILAPWCSSSKLG